MNVVDLAGPYFIDTNVLVYSFDDTAPEKQQQARSIIVHALHTTRHDQHAGNPGIPERGAAQISPADERAGCPNLSASNPDATLPAFPQIQVSTITPCICNWRQVFHGLMH